MYSKLIMKLGSENGIKIEANAVFPILIGNVTKSY